MFLFTTNEYMAEFTSDIFSLISKVSSEQDLDLTKDLDRASFVQKIESEFDLAKNDQIAVHGFRTEELFRYVVIGLGRTKVLKKEDAGEVFSNDEELRTPDYLIITHEEEKFFVEVKNFYQKKIDKPFRIKKSYLEKLQKYSDLHSTNLKFAIFWTKLKLWTLNLIDDFAYDGSKYYELDISDAMVKSEMGYIGEYQIGTTPPLRLRFVTDKSKPRMVNEEGEVEFTIGGVEILSSDTVIRDENEKRIAFYLMLYSKWDEFEEVANIDDENQLDSIEMILRPKMRSNPEENFEMMGFMSSLISIQFNQLTSNEGEVQKIRPKIDPENIGVRIGKDYSNKYLPLWLFNITVPHKKT